MKKKATFRELNFLSLLVMLLLLGSFFSSKAADVTISVPTTFAAADASDGTVDGIFTVTGNLTIASGGSITNNDPVSPPNNSAGPITIVVTGDMWIQAGGSINTENQHAAGNGGAITITIGGTFLNEGLISSSNLYATSGGMDGGAINIHVAGNTTLGGGSLINSEAAKGNGGAISMAIGLLPVLSSFTMNAGATISSSNTSGNGSGGEIIVYVTGDITMEIGSTIKGNSGTGPGGPIDIKGGVEYDPVKDEITVIIIDGHVLSQTGGSGAGCNPGHGGWISIISLQDLIINNTGVVSSKSGDPGADLVHLSGCNIVIYGLVESTGSGHAIPTCPVTHLVPPYRPDKPANSTAGVEVWAATLTIDNTFPNRGEINANLCCGGGTNGTSWIDLFAVKDIAIFGSTDVNDNFAVHANGWAGNQHKGGTITAKSDSGNVFTSGRATQTDGEYSGGLTTIEAQMDVDISSSTNESKGGGGSGGVINIRSYGTSSPITGNIVSDPGTFMDVIPSGNVTLTECGTAPFLGTVVPPPNPTPVTGVCDGTPSFEPYVIFTKGCVHGSPPPQCEPCTGPTIVVDQNVTIDFTTSPDPTYSGDLDLAPFFGWDKTGTTPDTWFATFDLGGNSLQVTNGATITVTKVGIGNNLYAPGLKFLACSVQMDNTCHIIVSALNKDAGDITILTHLDINVEGEILNEQTGTNGMPGDILLQSKCGKITVPPTGRIFDLGTDHGGKLISLLTCGDGGDITIDNGLVKAFAHAHSDNSDLTRPRIKVVSLNGAVTINANTAEPIYDEFLMSGGKYDIWGGLLSWVRDNNKPGMVWVQAAGDITVRGHGTDPTGPVETSFGAIAARATASNAPGGLVDIRSMGGSIFGFNRAFDVAGRNRLTVNYANIKLFANNNIVLTKTGLTATLNPVVDASGPSSGDKGGRNDLVACNGTITLNGGATVTACVPAGTQGKNYTLPVPAAGFCPPPQLEPGAFCPVTALWDFVCEDPLSPISREKSDIINTPVPSNGLLIYPNPAKESFTLQINNAINQGSILTLQDLAGKEILHTRLQLQEGVSSYPVSIAGISEGVYIVKLQTGTEVRQAKLIINR